MQISSSSPNAAPRLMDAILAAMILVLMAPVGIVVAVALTVEQRRWPLAGRPAEGPRGAFQQLAFRLVPGGWVSRLAHKAGLAVLPALLNVAHGDMMMIGHAGSDAPALLGAAEVSDLLDIPPGDAEKMLQELSKDKSSSGKLVFLLKMACAIMAPPKASN